MGQTESSPPIVEVSYEQLTYAELTKEIEKSNNQVQMELNRPQSVEQRLFVDVFGLMILYAGTFVVCDLIKAMLTGKWTSVAMMVLGPWNALTGAPLLHRIITILGLDKPDGQPPDTARCDNRYDDAKKLCRAEYAPFGGVWDDDFQQCMDNAATVYESCYENSASVRQCEQDEEDAWDSLTDQQRCPFGPGSCITPGDFQQDCMGKMGYDP